jgi:uncharacterized protein YndB with AHSA1/START domain
MTGRSAEHATYAIERVYDASCKRVFEAWSDPAAKSKWFGPTDSPGSLEVDFRIGGRERFSMVLPDGRTFGYDARFHEIVSDHRIVYAYSVDFDETRISVSLATVALTPAGDGTRLLYTEQAAFLDGGDTSADRERGTSEELDALAAWLR